MFIFGILRKYLIIAGVLGAVGFGLWKYYTYTQETIRVYAENAARAEMAQAETQAALEQTIKDLEKVQEKYNQVSADFNSAKKRVDGLQDKLIIKHCFGRKFLYLFFSFLFCSRKKISYLLKRISLILF